jgi:hypothetical protein
MPKASFSIALLEAKCRMTLGSFRHRHISRFDGREHAQPLFWRHIRLGPSSSG